MQTTSGGVLLPKAAVKFERYLTGEVSKPLLLCVMLRFVLINMSVFIAFNHIVGCLCWF